MTSEKSIFYQITVQGRLDPDWSDWLNGFEVCIKDDENGVSYTLLNGIIKDQAALRGVLTKIWDLNLELVAVDQKPIGDPLLRE